MPQLFSKYKIFLASPSDLVEEREAIDDVISELNLTYGNPNNIVIELLKWEKNSAPGISKAHVQSIITKDIGEYDLFIGLLWLKFGTSTGLYESGTEEEFYNAYNKFINAPNSIQILIYFKNSPPSRLDDIDGNQFLKIQAFKSTLGEKNTLYWEFSLKEDLQRFLRIHIPTRIEELRKTLNLPLDDLPSLDPVEVEIVEEEEELGILDLKEIYEDAMAASSSALIRISESTAWIGEEFGKKTLEIERIVMTSNSKPIATNIQRNIYTRTSKIMHEFATRIVPDISIYYNNYESGIDAYSKLIVIYKLDSREVYEEQILDAKKGLVDLLGQITFCVTNMSGFLHVVTTLPRISKELNKARKDVEKAMVDLLSKLEISYSLANELLKNIEE